MPDAIVKPKGSWRRASRADVKVEEADKPLKNIPIYRAKWTPIGAGISIHPDKYNRGIVLVCLKNLPDDDREALLPYQIGPKGKYDLKFKLQGEEVEGIVYLHPDTLESQQ